MNKLGVVNPRDPNAYKCFFCCHVKIGTILYGLFCLMMDIFFLGVVVLMSIHPDILVPGGNTWVVRGPQYDGIHMADEEQKLERVPDERFISRENVCMAYAVALMCILTSVALLYGVIRTRPGYMVPFLCQHVFLFCMSCLTLVSYFTYMPHFDVKMWLTRNGLSNLPGMDYVMNIDSEYLMFFVVTMLILALCFLAYLIGMIWACYKYVQQSAMARTLTREYRVDPDTEMLLPPRYEDAIKPENSVQPPPPPPYTQ
ncbi:hypothetical protein ACOMHN_010411 [Nucella lapillus]